ncbi:uncharacterized protein BX663DRAFT_493772 [Cokeromyces recurvatus]|uniref:uncharacterized protein n=1 Tax=Cokeromyces recurvatus TaxID=90255 RepID=UPI00221E6F04|nr:uncharacterized protein BX663DRAFT_493772 [Cokeromyces recurvatus]KAI7908311.1 hypothetical protein BX663DRAFT_493772 [Cokeromyces recurvatus]
MLTSLPLNQQTSSKQRYWPLNEIEENVMTLATCSQIKLQQGASPHHPLSYSDWYCPSVRSSPVRCVTCHRKFHSIGNLTNHQQLYQH